MSEIPRWTPKYLTSWEESGAMRPATHGGYVDYSDHVAAMQAAIPEPKFTVGDVVEWDSFGYKRFAVCQVIFDSKRGEWRYATETAVYFWESSLILYVPPTPEPKMRFNIGDRVVDGKWIGTVKFVTTFESRPTIYTICWDKGGVSDSDSESIVLYVPPTPAELIPTLKEHEWVRGTYKTGTAFGPCTTYYNEIGAMSAGNNHLIHWNTGKTSDELATLERCDAPEVK